MRKRVSCMTKPTVDDIQKLAELFGQSDWTQMRLKMDGVDVSWTDDSCGLSPEQSAAGLSPTNDAFVQIPTDLAIIRAPHVATFYGSPTESEPAYVVEGDTVDEDTEVCRIQVLETSTVLKAGTKGVIKGICLVDGQLAEFNVPLILIEPAA